MFRAKSQSPSATTRTKGKRGHQNANPGLPKSRDPAREATLWPSLEVKLGDRKAPLTKQQHNHNKNSTEQQNLGVEEKDRTP